MSVKHAFIIGALGVLNLASITPAQSQSADPLDRPLLCLQETVQYYDNLFRISRAADDLARLGPGASRSDTAFKTSACANVDWRASQQRLELNANIDDNRYENNDLLNHVSGGANLVWHWRTAGDWYGDIGGNYRHVLGTFLTDRPLVKDLVDSARYFGELNHDLGAFIKFNIGGSRTDTTHAAPERKLDNYRSTSGAAGITLISDEQNYLGTTYTQTRADYPFPVIVAAQAVLRDYQEKTYALRFRYALASKLILSGSAGRLQRAYPGSPDSDFSGQVWRVILNWNPSDKLRFELSGWKELGAYFDAQADQFIARGARLGVTWAPRDKLHIEPFYEWSRQDYLANTVTALSTTPRQDEVQSAGLEAVYRPRASVDIGVSHRYERHDSTVPAYAFPAAVSALWIRGRYR